MRSNTERLFAVVPIALIIAGTLPIGLWGAQSDKKGYVKRTFNPRAAAMAAAGAGINQGTDTPHEWGQGMAGFGRRFASSFGKHIVQKTIQYPIAKLLHEEISYRRSEKTGFGPRLKYALLATVITQKTTTGKKTLAVGEISGSIGSGLISRLWQPASTRTLAGGFESGGITLGIDAGLNVLREFWPEIRHPHRHNGDTAALAALPVAPVTSTAMFNPELDGEFEQDQPGEINAEVVVIDNGSPGPQP